MKRMSKPKKQRNVQHPPLAVYFKPQGIPLFQLEQIVLNVDEYEALRLVDYEGLNQLDAATQLGISRPTCARIVEQAHKKVAEAITLGKAIRIEGGAFALLKNLMRYQLIPIIDYTQAGEWREVIDTYQPGQGSDEVPVSSDRSDLIALRVKGNSMEPLIRNGQVVVVDPHRRPNNGDIVIAVKEGQSTIKRLHRVDDTTIILEPLNPAFEKIVLTRQDAEDLRIVGVVIEIKLIV